MCILYLVCKPFWRKNFDVGPACQKRTDKVSRHLHGQFVFGVFISHFYGSLCVMERKVPLEIGFLPISSETNCLHIIEVVIQDTIALGLILHCIKLRIEFELLIGKSKLLDPVE